MAYEEGGIALRQLMKWLFKSKYLLAVPILFALLIPSYAGATNNVWLWPADRSFTVSQTSPRSVEFPDYPVVVNKIFIKLQPGSAPVRIYFENPSLSKYFPEVMVSDDGNGTTVNISPYSNVRRVTFDTTSSKTATILALNFFGNNSASAPDVPKNFDGVPGVGKIDFSWLPNPESNIAGYNLYKDGIKVNSSYIVGTKYSLTGLPPDTSNSYQLTAVNARDLESDKTSAIRLSAQSPVKSPVLSVENLTDKSLRLAWESTGDSSSYKVYKDGVLSSQTSSLFFDFGSLDPNTSYSFRVDSIDRYGRSSTGSLTFKTKNIQLSVPTFTFSNVTSSSFDISWKDDPASSGYKVYLDGVEMTPVTGNAHSFSGLTASTVYGVKLVAYNDDADKDFSSSITTLAVTRPEITSASVHNVPGQSTGRQVEYQANDLVTAVNVYVNGKLVGTYPVSQNRIDLDFSDITDSMANIKIEPVDPDGVPYELTTPTNSTGSENVDDYLTEFLNAFGITRNAFVYLALASILVTVAVALFFWFRRKAKRLVGEDTKNSPVVKKGVIKKGKDSFREAFSKAPFKAKKKPFKPWDQMTEKEQSDWKKEKDTNSGRNGNGFSPKRFNRPKGQSGQLSKTGFTPKSSGGSRASPKQQVGSYKGKTYNLGARGDYKPFRNNGRNR